MQALQCFFLEFWDMETRPLDSLVAEPQLAGDGTDRRQLLQQLTKGGWCVQLPQVAAPCYPVLCISALEVAISDWDLPGNCLCGKWHMSITPGPVFIAQLFQIAATATACQ